MTPLVLSLFPGIGLLDRAFEAEGFTVVRGPDVLWGGDIREFHPPAGRFDGVIGGPPCQRFSPLANINRARYGEESLAPNLIPEFERCVAEASPAWFLMENVSRAPEPVVNGYVVRSQLLNNRWCGGEQNRERRFSFGTAEGLPLLIETEVFEAARFEPAVTATNGGKRAVPVIEEDGSSRGKQRVAG
jgi:DNA (cytosine-5)-methyltransferase 1